MRAILIVSVLLVCSAAQAVPVDHSAPDGVAARMISSGTAAVFVTVDGRAFIISGTPGNSWEETNPNWPIPFQDVAEIEGYFMIASNGDTWSHDWNWNSGLNWTLLPPLPIEPIDSEAQSIGDLKSMFR